MDKSYLLLMFLLLGHVLADFYFQPKSWVESRNSLHFRSFQLYYHILTHSVITFFIVYIYTQSYYVSIKSGLSILLAHYLIDLVKSYLPKHVIYFVLDQILHVITLFILWLLLSQESFSNSILKLIDFVDYRAVMILLAYVIVWKPVSIFISMVLSNWELTPIQEENSNSGQESLKSAGDAIGKIERVLILTFILCNQFSGIGFLLAAKSVFRFGDLTNSKDKKLTEYVMLGTLTSVAITIVIGLLVAYSTGILPKGK